MISIAANDCSCGLVSAPEISCYCVAGRLPLGIERSYEHTRKAPPTIGKLDASGVGIAVVYELPVPEEIHWFLS
jgi:hypothetical protein